MNLYENALSFTITFIILVLCAYILKRLGVIKSSDASFIAKITVDFILPALLVSKLVYVEINSDILSVATIIIVSEVVVGFIAYLIGSFALKLPKYSLGVFILCSSFGSTAILGTSFITAIFQGDQIATARALVVSQLSVGVPAYILFPIICSYFGEDSNASEKFTTRAFGIIASPCIIAIIIGLAWATLGIPTSGIIVTPMLNAANYVGSSLVFMVALLNGLAIERIPIKDYFLPLFMCVALVLVGEPLLVLCLDKLYGVSIHDQQVSFILAAMPSANSIIAFAIRYKCNYKLAATLVTSTTLSSAVTLPLIMAYVGIFT